MKPFEMSTITRPENLFGRAELLKRLTALARRNDNVQIIGSRRFGKTCVLRCMYTILRSEETVYPIYFDMKADAIKGTENVYKYLISVLVEHLYKDGHFKQPEKFSSVVIIPCDDWTTIFENLQQANVSLVKAQKMFVDIVNFFAELIGKNILFMFDEYEFMFKFGFDRPEGFMKLRTLSTSTLHNELHPFSFWIAGGKPWDAFCTLIGSGELNVINATEHILPITYDSFQEMWRSECELIEEEDLKGKVLSHKDEVYKASGGVPFYAKQIGAHFVSKLQFPTYQVLSTYFSEITSGLHPQEVKILDILQKSPKDFPPSLYITDLEIHGLIAIDEKSRQYRIPIGFYVQYLKANQQDKSQLVTREETVQQYVKKITGLVENINNTCRNKKGEYIFEPVNDSASLEEDLRTVCYDKNKFQDFCQAMYKYYLERSKIQGGKIGEKLPQSFQHNEFRKIVDACRHSFGGAHEIDVFEASYYSFTKEDVLEKLLGSKNEPNSPKEFALLQEKMLIKFIENLNRLNDYVRK